MSDPVLPLPVDGLIPTPPYVESGLLSLGMLIAEMRGGFHDDWTGSGPCGNNGPEWNVENDVFAIRAYCWCDGEGEHAESCPPNFAHYAAGFAVTWYKYVGRSSWLNRPVTAIEWEQIRASCIAEIQRIGVPA